MSTTISGSAGWKLRNIRKKEKWKGWDGWGNHFQEANQLY